MHDIGQETVVWPESDSSPSMSLGILDKDVLIEP